MTLLTLKSNLATTALITQQNLDGPCAQMLHTIQPPFLVLSITQQ